jgi:2-phospho-L-lactate guanylyltransferase (CobY/MobA/RfbA family)
MPTIVVPFRGANGKQRVELPQDDRTALARAMLDDVVAACAGVGEVVVATAGGGQGPAVAQALTKLHGRVLIVNADLPCARPDDIRALDAAVPPDGVAYVEARDGTTNALGFSSSDHFAPLYGPGSAQRFRDHARSRGVDAVAVDIPNLVDDVDSLDDLERLDGRVGPRTCAVLAR